MFKIKIIIFDYLNPIADFYYEIGEIFLDMNNNHSRKYVY